VILLARSGLSHERLLLSFLRRSGRCGLARG